MAYEKYHRTTVECYKIRPHTKELVDRCGTYEAAGEYALIGANTLRRIMHGVNCTVQQGTAKKILTALEHRRQEDRLNHETHERLLKERQRLIRMDREVIKIHN